MFFIKNIFTQQPKFYIPSSTPQKGYFVGTPLALHFAQNDKKKCHFELVEKSPTPFIEQNKILSL